VLGGDAGCHYRRQLAVYKTGGYRSLPSEIVRSAIAPCYNHLLDACNCRRLRRRDIAVATAAAAAAAAAADRSCSLMQFPLPSHDVRSRQRTCSRRTARRRRRRRRIVLVATGSATRRSFARKPALTHRCALSLVRRRLPLELI